MKKLILFVALIFPQLSMAESAEFLNAHKSFFSLLSPESTNVSLGYILERSHDEENGNGSFDLNNFSLDVDLAKATSQDSFINYGGHYEARAYDFDNVVGIASTGSETFHRLELDFGMGKFIHDDLLAHAQVSLGLHSNLEDLDGDAFSVLGKGILVYRFNPGVQFLGGLSATEEFDDTSVFPLLGLRLQSTDGKMHISLTAPLSLRVTYNLSPASQIYTGYWISGNEYNLEVNGTKFDVFQQDRRAGVGYTHWFNGHLNLTFETGAAIGSELEFKLPGAGSFSDGDLDNAFYAALRVGYAL